MQTFGGKIKLRPFLGECYSILFFYRRIFQKKEQNIEYAPIFPYLVKKKEVMEDT
jgi:hypothetical protein